MARRHAAEIGSLDVKQFHPQLQAVMGDPFRPRGVRLQGMILSQSVESGVLTDICLKDLSEWWDLRGLCLSA